MSIVAITKGLLEMDLIGTRIEGDKVVYTYKTKSLIPSIVEAKAKILSAFHLPVDIPCDIKVNQAKRGLIYKEYVVDVTVPANKAGVPSNLLAKNYPVVPMRKRPYRA